MSVVIWGLNLVPVTVLFLSIHFIVGTIRGIYRYRMIEKYQCHYYNNYPLKLTDKLRHNLFYGTFRPVAFYVSVSLTIMVLIASTLP